MQTKSVAFVNLKHIPPNSSILGGLILMTINTPGTQTDDTKQDSSSNAIMIKKIDISSKL